MRRLFLYLLTWATVVVLLAACASAAATSTTIPATGAMPPATTQASNRPTNTTVFASTPTRPGLPTASATAPIPLGKQVEDGLKIPMRDGVDLIGTFYAPQQARPPWPAVLLLHMAYGNRQTWGDFPEKLAAAGYAVLAIDLRGQGESGGSLDWSKGPQDVAQAWQYLIHYPQVDPQSTAIVGASFGANLALVQGTAEGSIRTVVLLSPGLDYFGVSTADAIKAYGERPVLIAASSEDSYAAESSRQLKQMAKGSAELLMFDGAGHGIHMLAAQAGLAEQIIDWLDQYLKSQ
jgi:dipeptidyl aminopeptidase/acylaminoacyl peptidase